MRQLLSRFVCVLDDGDLLAQEITELLDRHGYCIFQEYNFDRFMTMVADIDPDVIVITEATSSADGNIIPMLRLFTDNVIAVVGHGESAPSALLQGADLCISEDMPEGELLARLHACERRLLASTA